MSLITGSIKDILSIKLKCRHDGYTDQFSRIFMTKMFIISSLIMSVDFFNDKVSCIVPPNTMMSLEFVHSTCWIQGFYIYAELKNRTKKSGYFGIPINVQMNGMYKSGKLCSISKVIENYDPDCIPMTKVFFLQYQYFPFYIASLAILYYMPYIFFRMVNVDLISLKSNMKEANFVCPKKIVDNYFNYNMNGGRNRLRLRVILNVAIKCLYVVVNIVGFILTNVMLNNKYKSYGLEWIRWARLNNTLAFDYSGARDSPKPGNFLLPAMGFCEITEGTLDLKTHSFNRSKFICEISPNVLYQYVLIVLWFFFVMGIVVSFSGVLMALVMYTFYFFKRIAVCNKESWNTVYYDLTIREIEYLQFLRRKNLTMYGDVQRWLKRSRFNVEIDVELTDVFPARNSVVGRGSEVMR